MDLLQNNDLTFYVMSSTNDELTCNSKTAKAVLSDNKILQLPGLTSIWDVNKARSIYHCYLNKSFYVPGRPVSATVDVFTDDTTTMFINDVNILEITKCVTCLQSNINILSYIKIGLNILYIDADNTLGDGYFGYRLTIKTKLI